MSTYLLNVSNTSDDAMQASINKSNIYYSIYIIELDSHTNIHVVGWNAYIMSDTGETADVNSCKPKMYLANSYCGYSSTIWWSLQWDIIHFVV